MKDRLGILGGMGPMATADFYQRLIRHTPANRDQDHIDVVLLGHATLPDRTAGILAGDHGPFLAAVAEDLALLGDLGVRAIAMPCNTAHYYHRRMQKMTGVPILHMVKETIKDARSRAGAGGTVGILATDGTVKSGLYQDVAREEGLAVAVPTSKEQQAVMAAIYAVKAGKVPTMAPVEALTRRYLEEEGCSTVLIACTEASLLPLSPDLHLRCIDAMDVLVHRSIALMGRRPLPGLLAAYDSPQARIFSPTT